MAQGQATNVHVERGRQIADALDSQDVEGTLHEQFCVEWKAWEAEDPTRSMREFDRAIGRGNDYTGRIVRIVTGGAGWRGGSDTPEDRQARAPKTEETAERLVQNILEKSPPGVVDTVYQGLREGRENRYVEPRERERRHKEAEAWSKGRVEPIVNEASKMAAVLSLENALEELQEATSIDGAAHDQIIRLTDEIRHEAEVKRAMEGVR